MLTPQLSSPVVTCPPLRCVNPSGDNTMGHYQSERVNTLPCATYNTQMSDEDLHVVVILARRRKAKAAKSQDRTETYFAPLKSMASHIVSKFSCVLTLQHRVFADLRISRVRLPVAGAASTVRGSMTPYHDRTVSVARGVVHRPHRDAYRRRRHPDTPSKYLHF